MAHHLAANRLKGRIGEALACLLLLAKGYRLVTRNSRAGGAEVDAIWRQGDTLVLVEVKFRPTLAAGHVAIHPHQKARLQRQLNAWQQRLRHQGSVRLDVVLVAPIWPFIEHHRNVG